MTDTPFAERLYEIDGLEVPCRFFSPVADGDDFRCRYWIEAGAASRSRDAWGVDAVQALLLAMTAAHTDLLMWREQEGKTVRWLEGEGLGLPGAEIIRDFDGGQGFTAPSRA
jgi:hypothetical protein